MKKWVLAVILTLNMTACNSNEKESHNSTTIGTALPKENIEATKNENTASSKINEEPEKEDVPTLEELMKKSNEAIKQLKSYAMESSSVHKLSAYNHDQSQKELSSLIIKKEHSIDPFKIHMIITTKVGDDTQEYEQYLTDEGMYELEGDEWFHIINDSTPDLIAHNKSSHTLSDQLIRTNLILDQTKLTVDKNNYILTSDVYGDKIKQLATTLLNMDSGNSDEDGIVQEALDQMHFTSLTLTTKIAKDTLIPISTDAQITRYFNLKGNTVFVDSETNIKFDRFNEVLIKVPREALDSAIWE